jgi:ABC-type sugar transport system permease subunit
MTNDERLGLSAVLVLDALMSTAFPSERPLSPGEQRRLRWYRLQRAYEGYFFLAPNISGFLLFTAFPVIASFALSFFRWDLLTPPVYVGTQQFEALLFNDPQFRRVAFNTFYFTVGTVPARVVLSLLLALALNQALRGITAYRVIYFMPVVTSLVAAALVFQWIFNGNFGILNGFLWGVAGLLHIPIQPPDWLNSTKCRRSWCSTCGKMSALP